MPLRCRVCLCRFNYIVCVIYVICIWPHGVTVSTLDSESSDRGSNPREAPVCHVRMCAQIKTTQEPHFTTTSATFHSRRSHISQPQAPHFTAVGATFHRHRRRRRISQPQAPHFTDGGATCAAFINWPRGVIGSTLDSESSDRGSNPREAPACHVRMCAQI